MELNSIYSDEDEPRLHLIIQSQHERDTEKLDGMLSIDNNQSQQFFLCRCLRSHSL